MQQRQTMAAGTAATWTERTGRAATRLLIVLACLTIFLPMLLTLYLSLFNEQMIVFPPHGYTLAWYPRIAANFGAPIWNSLRIALAAVALSLLIGIPAGIGLSRYRFRGRDAVSTLLLAPLTIPGIAIGLAIYVLAVWIEEQTNFALAGSIKLLVLAHVLITMPWVVRLCLASLTNHERTTEEAAASLGANPLMVIWRVTLPAMRSGIVAAALFPSSYRSRTWNLTFSSSPPASTPCRSPSCNTCNTTSTRWSPPSPSPRWRSSVAPCCCSTASSAWARYFERVPAPRRVVEALRRDAGHRLHQSRHCPG
jgi:putative spermidine/putrescine transport system permease protein